MTLKRPNVSIKTLVEVKSIMEQEVLAIVKNFEEEFGLTINHLMIRRDNDLDPGLVTGLQAEVVLPHERKTQRI